MASGGVEGAAFGILDARIVVERGFFGAASVFDALSPGKRVDVGRVKIEIASERPELRGVGNAAERIFGGDSRQLECGLQHAVESFAREVAGVGAGGTLAVKYAHANGARACFFKRFHLAEADQRGKFVAFADYALGGGGAAGHGAADNVLGYFTKISFQLSVFSCQFSLRHKK